MKKLTWKSLGWFMMCLCALNFTACGDDEPAASPKSEQPGGGNEEYTDPEKPDESDALSPEEQKERLEEIALQLSEEIPASDFEDIVDLGKYLREVYIEGYDWDNVSDWASEVFEELVEPVGKPKKETNTETNSYSWGTYTSTYTYITQNYKVLLAAANFTGHFKANNGRWIQSKADDLQFLFTDAEGNQCTLSATTSGNTTTLYIGEFEDHDYDWWYDEDHYYEEESTNLTKASIKVPEQIVVTLRRNGANVVKISINLNLSNLQSSNFNLAKSNLVMSTKVELNNGYTFNLSQVNYSPSKLAVEATMSKGSKTLASVTVSATPEGLPNVNLVNGADINIEKTNLKNAFVKVDVMGEVQLQGTLSNYKTLINYLDKAKQNNGSESTFKSYVNQANGLLDINLFYDNSAVKQATVKLQAFEEYSYYYGRRWKSEPVLTFYDGSSYSNLGAFFNEDDFRSVIDAFQRLAEEFRSLVD